MVYAIELILFWFGEIKYRIEEIEDAKWKENLAFNDITFGNTLLNCCDYNDEWNKIYKYGNIQ